MGRSGRQKTILAWGGGRKKSLSEIVGNKTGGGGEGRTRKSNAKER